MNLQLVQGEGQLGPLLAAGTICGGVGVLAAATAGGLPVVEIAPLVALLAVAAVGYRSLLAWRPLLALMIGLMMLVPIRRYEVPVELPFELEPYRILVAAVALGWLTSLLIDPRVRLRASGLEAPLGFFVLAVIASELVNPGRIDPDVVKRLTFFLSFLLVFYLVVSVVRTLEGVDVLLSVLVGTGAIVAALAIVEARTHVNLFNRLDGYVPLLQLSELPLVPDRGARLRVYGSAQHPIALCAVLVMLIPIAVYLARRTGRKLWWAAAAVLSLGAVATVSRTSILMLVVVGLVFLWLRPVQTRRLWPALLPLAIVVHLALPGTIGALRQSFFPEGGLVAEQAAFAGYRGAGRIADLAPALDQFASQPLLGLGFATRVVDEGALENAVILDNQWLGLLLETGLVGVLALLWLFRRAIKRLGAAAKEDDSDRGWLLAAVAASLTAYAVGMITFDAFSFIQVTFVMFVLLALGTTVLRLDRPS